MPTCKVSRSTTRRRRYKGGASSGEVFMRDALDFYFVIVTKQYNRENPLKKIAPPTSEEFLAYASALSTKAMEEKKSSGGSRYRKLRRVKSRKIVGGGVLGQLLGYIFGPSTSICEKIFYNLAVLLMAAWVAALAYRISTLRAEDPSMSFYTALQTANADPDVANSIGDPVRWGCSKIMPRGLEYYDASFTVMADMINRGLSAVPEDQVEGISSGSVIYVGIVISKILNLLMNSYLYKKMVVRPGAYFLKSIGITSCEEVYERATAAEVVPISTIYSGLSEKIASFVTVNNVNVLGDFLPTH